MQFNLQLTFDFLLKTLSRYQGSVATLIISLKMIQPKWVEKEMNSIRNLISNRNNVYHIGFIPPRDLEFLVHLLKDQSLLFLHLCLTSLKAYKVIFSLSCFINDIINLGNKCSKEKLHDDTMPSKLQYVNLSLNQEGEMLLGLLNRVR